MAFERSLNQVLKAGARYALDGGFATELENMGFDLSSNLWSARLLRDNPSAISQVHLKFMQHGARVVITASYQASCEGFAKQGLTNPEEVDRLLTTSVTLAQQARETWFNQQIQQGRSEEDTTLNAPLIAASVGPYGAMLGNGAEYTGKYNIPGGKSEILKVLKDFHRPRLMALLSADPPPELLAYETIPNLIEAQAIHDLQTEYTP